VLCELADLLFVQPRDGVAVDRPVAVLGVVPHQRLAAVARPQHERVLVVANEIVQHGPTAHAEVPNRELVALGVGICVEERVDQRIDLYHVVLDTEQVVGDPLGVAHVVRAVDFARHHEAVHGVLPQRLDGQMGDERAVDTTREPHHRAVDPGGVELPLDEPSDVLAVRLQFGLGEGQIERVGRPHDGFGVGHVD